MTGEVVIEEKVSLEEGRLDRKDEEAVIVIRAVTLSFDCKVTVQE